MDDATAEMLRATVRHLLETTAGPALVGELLALGWVEIVADDEAAAAALLFGAQGAALASSSALDLVVLAALGREPGSARVVYPDPLAGEGHGLALGGVGPGPDDEVVVLGPGPRAEAVVARPGVLAATAVAGIDPDLGLVRVDLAALGPAKPLEADPAVAWAAARRALAHEILGASDGMLALAQEHVRDRHQFGRPIGSFQAVRHRLADAAVATSAAQAAVEEAGRGGGPAEAALAKALAGRAATVVGAAALQVTGGMGFTWEHPLHRHLRRTMALNALLGSADQLAATFGADILATGQVPRLGHI